MLRLAIDTSAHLCAACLYDTAKKVVLASQTEDIGRGHAEILMDVINACLTAGGARYEDLAELAVTTGPGSFAGVRVGMATARALALSLNVPVAGISTLETCLELGRDGSIDGTLVAVIDARRNEAYCQIDGQQPMVSAYDSLASSMPDQPVMLCGSGAARLNEVAGMSYQVMHGAAVAPIEVIAAMRLQAGENPPEPLYLRSADAKPQAGFVLQRAGE